MYERDLYRDDVITMDNNLELRLPFLDRSLVEYALKIPEEYKLTIFNIIMKKSNLKAIQLEDEMNLPLHISLPSIKEINKS